MKSGDIALSPTNTLHVNNIPAIIILMTGAFSRLTLFQSHNLVMQQSMGNHLPMLKSQMPVSNDRALKRAQSLMENVFSCEELCESRGGEKLIILKLQM